MGPRVGDMVGTPDSLKRKGGEKPMEHATNTETNMRKPWPFMENDISHWGEENHS